MFSEEEPDRELIRNSSGARQDGKRDVAFLMLCTIVRTYPQVVAEALPKILLTLEDVADFMELYSRSNRTLSHQLKRGLQGLLSRTPAEDYEQFISSPKRDWVSLALRKSHAGPQNSHQRVAMRHILRGI